MLAKSRSFGHIVYICGTALCSTHFPRCYKDVYAKSFFPRTARLWNSLPIKWFPFNCRFFLDSSLVCLILFVFLFLVTPCLVVTVQPCTEWIPIKNKQNWNSCLHFFSFLNQSWSTIKKMAAIGESGLVGKGIARRIGRFCFKPQ